jgi:two-component system chemotaxis response regulator CheB
MAAGAIKKVLIVEDSIFIQKILARIIESDSGLQVAGIAKNGKVAVDMARNLRPDVITMDIRMPVMDGFQATRLIMSENPIPILVVSSSVNDEDLKISFNAIQAGALDIMEKPRGHLSGDYLEIGRDLIHKIRLISEIRVFRHIMPKRPGVMVMPPKGIEKTRSRALAIGASTGGPSALFQILTSFDRDFPVPVFVTLHISEGFGKGCAEWIRRNSRVDVRVPVDGEHIQPGTVYFAPDDRVMRTVSRNFISVDAEKMNRRSMPINVMMESFAEVWGPGAVGVLLTGMGDDGARGMKNIRDGGGRTIAQDEETSVVFGMPREAIALGAADSVLPLERIPTQIVQYLRG